MKKISLLFALILLFACNGNNGETPQYDGRLELEVIRLSAQTAGEIDSMAVDEGDQIKMGQLLARIDPEDLKLQKQQQEAALEETRAALKKAGAHETQLQAQLKLNADMLRRTRNMLEKGATTQLELDRLLTEKDVLEAQMNSIAAERAAIVSKQKQIQSSLNILQRQVEKTVISSPIDGAVMSRLRRQYEVVAPGVPLFEVADPKDMEAVIYVPLEDLPNVQIGQAVALSLQGIEGRISGKVRSISEQAEFTPKTILTPETRQTLVYAVTINVANNDGKLKAGMPVLVSLTEK